MQKLGILAGAIGVLALMGGMAPVVAAPSDTALIGDYMRQGFSEGVSQVNSVSELSDVDPNSWAFQALKTVVERYGCLEGYPNKTYQGNKPLTRYEFAAGLNACLERVNELITANTANKATREDLATLQRLQDEFRTELAALRGRVDALEAKTRDIESKLFNTNAKLDGSVVMAITGGGGNSNGVFSSPIGVGVGSAYGDSQVAQLISTLATGSPVLPTAGLASANASFTARTTLNIRATFSGNDELLVRLRGVTGQDVGALFAGVSGGRGTLFSALGPGNLPYDQSISNTGVSQGTNGAALVVFDKIRYTTNLFSDKFRIFIGPRIDLFEFIDTNSFANNEEIDFASGFHINNPLTTFVFAGPGGGFDWQIADWIGFRAAYIAPTGGSVGASPLTQPLGTRLTPFGATTGLPFGGGGIIGGTYTVVTELELNPSRSSAIKLQYAHFYEQNAVLGTNVTGLATAGVTDTVGVNAEWAVTPNVGIFGRFGYGWTNLQGLAAGLSFDQIQSLTWQAGLALPGLFGAGNTFSVAYGQPLRVNSGSLTVAGVGTASFVPTGTEGNIEAFFRFRVSDRLSITPDFQYIFQGANINGNQGISIGTLRATFTF